MYYSGTSDKGPSEIGKHLTCFYPMLIVFCIIIFYLQDRDNLSTKALLTLSCISLPTRHTIALYKGHLFYLILTVYYFTSETALYTKDTCSTPCYSENRGQLCREVVPIPHGPLLHSTAELHSKQHLFYPLNMCVCLYVASLTSCSI